MPVSKDISLNVLASVQGYAKELGKIPGITEKEAAKAAKALGAQLAKAEVIALKNAGSAAEQSAQGFQELGRAAGALSPQLGAVARDAEDLLTAFGPAGAAAGLGLAVAGIGVGMVKMTAAAAASSKELEKIGLISKETGQALRDAQVTVDLAAEAWKGMGAVLTERVSFALQGLIRWTFIAAMAWDDFINGRGVQGLEVYVARVEDLEGAVRGVTGAVKDETAAVQSSLPFFDQAAQARLALVAAEAEWNEQGKAGLDLQRQRLASMVEAHAIELELSAQRLERMQLEGATGDEQALARQARHTQEIAFLTQEGQLSAQIAEQEQAQRRAVANAYLSSAAAILGSLQGMVEQGSIAAKALASLQVVVSTSAAIMNALATPPFPLGVALAAGAATLGAVQLAAVWAAQPGTKSAPRAGSVASHAVQAQERRNRLDDDAPRRSSGGPSAVIMFRHRLYDDWTRDALRRDSPLTRSMQRNGNRSH